MTDSTTNADWEKRAKKAEGKLATVSIIKVRQLAKHRELPVQVWLCA